MVRNNNMQRVNEDIRDIRKHMEKLNDEMGDALIKIAKIETSWGYMKYIIGVNVTLWVVVIGILMKMNGF